MLKNIAKIFQFLTKIYLWFSRTSTVVLALADVLLVKLCASAVIYPIFYSFLLSALNFSALFKINFPSMMFLFIFLLPLLIFAVDLCNVTWSVLLFCICFTVLIYRLLFYFVFMFLVVYGSFSVAAYWLFLSFLCIVFFCCFTSAVFKFFICWGVRFSPGSWGSSSSTSPASPWTSVSCCLGQKMWNWF